jgi:PadR family transcriptional regulator
MKYLTRSEEFVLLAVWRLQEGAYTLNIRGQLSKLTGQEWSLGSVYTPLERLGRRRFLTSRLSDSTPDRGGRKRRIYDLTKSGKEALIRIRTIESTMWAGVHDQLIES